jgi:hypothetical protein
MKHRLFRIIGLGLFVTVFATACDDAIGPEGEVPELPPLSTFTIDFSDFTESGMATTQMGVAAAAAGTYWTRSAVVVGVWNLIIAGTLAPPTAAFIASFNHEPVWDGEAWTWSYDFSVLSVQHSARLEATFISAGVQWDMFITREGGFTDFHWFTGVSHLSGTSGTWSLNRGPDNPSPFIDIEWSRAASGETYGITYTNVVSGADEYGSFIEYAVTGETPFDAFYSLYGAQGGNLTEIEWNRTTKDGRTRDPAWFQDSDWRCWDSALENTTCQ